MRLVLDADGASPGLVKSRERSDTVPGTGRQQRTCKSGKSVRTPAHGTKPGPRPEHLRPAESHVRQQCLATGVVVSSLPTGVVKKGHLQVCGCGWT